MTGTKSNSFQTKLLKSCPVRPVEGKLNPADLATFERSSIEEKFQRQRNLIVIALLAFPQSGDRRTIIIAEIFSKSICFFLHVETRIAIEN